MIIEEVMSVQYKPGTLSDYTDSMAEKIRTVFERLWNEEYGTNLPPETRDERRLLFVAIAQGVIQHLKSNALDAFDIEVNVEQQTDTGPWITSKGDTGNASNGYGHTHPVQVDQKNSPDNKIKSEGEGKEDVRVNILTTGELL
jgi:hypothetical protein